MTLVGIPSGSDDSRTQLEPHREALEQGWIENGLTIRVDLFQKIMIMRRHRVHLEPT
jgi:hypothetical protein